MAEPRKSVLEPYYQDEQVTIYHAQWEAVFMSLKQCDHVITDPPYSEHTHSNLWTKSALTRNGAPREVKDRELGFDPLSLAEIEQLAASIKVQCRRWSLVFCDLESTASWKASFERADLEYVRGCIWDKVGCAPQFSGDRPASGCEAFVLGHPPGRKNWNGGGRKNLYSFPVRNELGGKVHPAQKPIALMKQLVVDFTNPGDLIVDPYMGSGTTLRAAKDLGRKAIGIEVQERYCGIAAKRMAQETLEGIFEPPTAVDIPIFFDEGEGGDHENE